MSKKVGVVRFLGTNCDRDVWQALESVGLEPQWLWYQDTFDWHNYSAVVLPGGFSYGDYLRSGALAAKSPVMDSVKHGAENGLPILGICNGFQILCDAGLLPGALIRNENRKFVDKWVKLKMTNSNRYWAGLIDGDCEIPVAHGDGRYYIDDEGLKKLKENKQIWLLYNDNPNGSIEDIAGVMNEAKNVVGLMPHPERAMFTWMGTDHGRQFFTGLAGAQ